MKILVTGANGFLGSHVLSEACRLGLTVFAGTGPSHKIADHSAAVPIDLTNEKSVRNALSRYPADIVVNCAAYGVDYRQKDLELSVQVNVLGPSRLFRLAHEHGAKRFIQIGTSYEYGSNDRPVRETDPLRPEGTYGATKAGGTLLLRAQAGSHADCELAVLRPFNIFGPGEGEHKLVPQIFAAAASGRRLPVSAGLEERDFIFVEDVVRAIVALAILPSGKFPAGRVLNLCSGTSRTVRDMILLVAGQLGIADLIGFGELPSRPDAPSRVVGDPSAWNQFCEESGLQHLTRLTSIPEAISRMK